MFDFGTAPAVDRLIVVSHNTQIAMILCQGLDDSVLAAIGVLIFVDQQVIEQRCFGAAYRFDVREQLFGQEQQVVKVHCPALFEPILITTIRHCREMFLVRTRDCRRVGRANALRFPTANKVEQVTRAKYFVGDADVAKHAPSQTLLVTPVVDRKLGGIAKMLNLPAQNADAMRMKCGSDR